MKDKIRVLVFVPLAKLSEQKIEMVYSFLFRSFRPERKYSVPSVLNSSMTGCCFVPLRNCSIAFHEVFLFKKQRK